MKTSLVKKTVIAGVLSTALLTSGVISLPIDNGQVYAASATSKIEKSISIGKKYMGTPYEFGSNRSTTRTFDCSDFT
ncbi:hypothetical protein D3C79_1044980 [compost metagenome]